jgi:hypothetical protein
MVGVSRLALKIVVMTREQGTGNREQGTGNREQGTGNREQGTGNRCYATGTGKREEGRGKREEVLGNFTFRYLCRFFPFTYLINNYSSSRYYEVQILMIKLLWCGHLARIKCTSLKATCCN